jgi:hypothetical protein
MPKVTWSSASAAAIVCIFCALTYVRSGALTAALETTVVAVSLFTILKVKGQGKWSTAFRSLLDQPAQSVAILLLMGLFFARRWETLAWQDSVDLILVGSFYWGFFTFASSFFEKHFFTKTSKGNQKSSGQG